MKERLPFLLFLLLLLSCGRKSIEEKVQTLIERNRYREALSLIERTGDNAPSLKILKATIYVRTGRFEKAYETLRKLSTIPKERENDFKELLLCIADSSLYYNRRYLAKESLLLLISHFPRINLGERYSFLGDYYFYQGEYKRALEFYNRYLDAGGTFKNVAPSYMRSLYELGEYGKILDLKEKVRRGEFAEVDWIVGNTLYKLALQSLDSEEYDSTILYTDMFLKWETPRILLDDIYFLRGKAFAMLGDTLNAIKNLKKVLNVFRARTPLKDSARILLRELSQ